MIGYFTMKRASFCLTGPRDMIFFTASQMGSNLPLAPSLFGEGLEGRIHPGKSPGTALLC
eukprot:6606450-Prorocentrum_lima.AAC.1